jgi:signal transduction histidine kinase
MARKRGAARVTPVGTQAKHTTAKNRNGRRRGENSADRSSVFAALLDSVDIGVAIVSTRGIIQYSNPHFAELIGAPPFRELKGSDLKSFVSADSWIALDNALRESTRAVAEGRLVLENLESLESLENLEFRRRTVRVSFLPLRQAESDTQIGIVATETTKLMQSAAALKASEAALQSLSARLMKVQDDERRHLARDLHDTIGQELAVAVMRVEQMAKQASSPDVNLHQQLMECSEWLRKIESETRTLSYVLHPPLLDQMGLMAALNWYIEGFSKRSGLKVQLEATSGIPRLEVEEETALFRIVQESLTNVLRHSGSSEAHVKVSVEGNRVAVSIKDQGRGFPADKLEGQKAAVGVGVAGMRGRLTLVNGTLEIRSTEHGTTVKATVPWHRAEVEEPAAAARPAALEPSPPEPASVARILIADDHEIARRGIRDLFREEPDLEICGEARDGLEALAKVEELKPDLLIVDLSMPNMGGYSVAHRLRNSQPSVKILIYSTHSHSDVERMARTVGCKGCVHKANAARDLVRGVRAILRGGTFYEHDESPAAGGRTRTISCGELPPRG